MTTGAPIYLVSACGSPEEFVAAFRRYTDRGGVFVPIAEPIPAGRRGRFALTLKDGGVMIEGEAEVVTASAKPQGIHGRPGMTLKFVEPDEPSKTMLAELEKARLALRPQAPSVAPRPAPLPAEPRPVPPPTGGRIDASNALAQCVAIGEVSGLRETTRPVPKLAVPSSIPDRLKSPSTPPASQPARVTTFGMPAAERPPADAVPATERPPAEEPPKPIPTHKPTAPFGVPTSEAAKSALPPPRRQHPTTAPPPGPRRVTPVAPLPIVRAPAATASVEPEAEPTELQELPKPPPDPAPVVNAAPPAPLLSDPVPPAPPARSGGMRASEIMAAIPNEDWTMTPDASRPTVIPTKLDPQAPFDRASPSGDWTMHTDPGSTDGWTPPVKLNRAAEAGAVLSTAVPGATGNPSGAVAEKAIEAVVHVDKPAPIGEPKIEVDPSLMEPAAKPSPPAAIGSRSAPPPIPRPGPTPPPPLAGTGPHAVLAAQGPERLVTDAGTGFFRESGSLPRLPTEETYEAEPRGRRRLVIIAVSAAAVLAVVVGVVILVGRGQSSSKSSPSAAAGSAAALPIESSTGSAVTPPTGSATPPPSGSAAGSAATPAVGSSGSATVEAPPTGSAGSGSASPVAAITEPAGSASESHCSVELTTVPPGAQVAIGTQVLGTTPGTFDVPCGVETKLSIHKARYLAVTKTITATPETSKLDPIKLGRVQFAVKVTSAPPGAAITVGGRPMGATPTILKLPAFEASTITLTKDGFAPETQKLTPKVNNSSLHVGLKKRR